MKKDKILRVLYELINNSKKSDRELAKALNSSQPTITRIRKKVDELLKEQGSAILERTMASFRRKA